MTGAVTYDGEAESLEGDLAQHEQVDSIETLRDRRPHRLKVGFDQAEKSGIPEGVQDLLAQHQATIEDVGGVGTARWHVLVRPAQPWRRAGQRTIRAHGSSIVCTLTRQALEVSGLGEDTDVNVEAREDEVRITRRADE